MATNFSEVLIGFSKGLETLSSQPVDSMTFYRVNDYFVLKRMAATACLIKDI